MGLRPCLEAAASLARTMAPAPSEMPEALPAGVVRGWDLEIAEMIVPSELGVIKRA